MDIIPDKRRLIGLVEQTQHGKLCLPQFQRDFVWTREEIADLLRSILRGYFVGSLLILRCDPDRPPFAPVALRGSTPESVRLAPDGLVLDGQQRLTSLLYALTAPDLGLKNSRQRRYFFVDLDLLASDIDDDDIVIDVTERERRREGLDTDEGQWTSHRMPCTALLREQDFFRWRDGIDDWLHANNPEDHQTYRDEWRPAWTTAVNRFQSFEVPVVELPRVEEGDKDAIARVCAIFEKLNSTGVALSVYDLLTARLFRSGIDLHRLWDDAMDECPRIADWSGRSADTNKFGVLVLRTLALIRGEEPKPKNLINLNPKDFESDWQRSTKALERALELLESVTDDGFGVFEKKWLPGFGLVPVLAALRAHIEDNNLGSEARSDVRRWYWSSVFLERYSSAVETKSRRDYNQLVERWSGNDVRVEVFDEAAARIGAEGYRVRDSASHASSVYSGLFCLLALNGARDWSVVESIPLQQLEDHHVFPRSYLLHHGFDSQKDKVTINSIVNRTLISDGTNRRISDRAPADYLSDESIFQGPAAELLEQHFVVGRALDAMESATAELSDHAVRDVFEEFCSARQAAMIAEIRRRCGIDRPVQTVIASDR